MSRMTSHVFSLELGAQLGQQLVCFGSEFAGSEVVHDWVQTFAEPKIIFQYLLMLSIIMLLIILFQVFYINAKM